MAYRKRNASYKKSPRRGRGRRRYSNNRNFTYGNVLDKVIGDVARLKTLINVEFKKIDISSTQTPNQGGVILLLNASVVGDDFDNRDGRQIRFKSIQYSLNILQNPTATQTITRCLLVIDKQPNGVLITTTELLTSNGNNLDFRNLDNRKRFVILSDMNVAQSSSANTIDRLDFYKKIDMITVYDDSNNGNITDITTNAFFSCNNKWRRCKCPHCSN